MQRCCRLGLGVDLLGRYSNRLTLLDQLARVVGDLGRAVVDPVETSVSVRSDRAEGEPWAVVDRLGPETLDALVAKFMAGATAKALAVEFGVSLSTVKRVLRGRGVRRLARAVGA